MKLLLQNKLVYGKVLVYPKNETAEVFASLLQKRTFSERDITLILRLGLEVEYLPDSESSPSAQREGLEDRPKGQTGFTFGPDHAVLLREICADVAGLSQAEKEKEKKD